MVAEFQAVILAYGRSSPLEELTPTAKPLLRIGNFPLIYYPLQWLLKNGFNEAIIVVSESTEKDVFQALAPYFETKMNLDFVSIADREEYGTADTLRDLHKKRKLKQADLLLLSCDVIADICLQDVANLFRMHDATLMVLYQKALPNDLLVPGAKAKKHHDREIVVLEPTSSRVILATSEADVEGFVQIPRYLLTRYPRLRIRTALQDAHIYLLKNWVLNFLASETEISSIRSELIPKLIKKQHSSKSQKKTTNFEKNQKNQKNQKTEKNEATKNTKNTKNGKKNSNKIEELDKFSAEEELELLAREMSMWSDHQGDMAETYFGNSIRCYAHLADNSFCMRVNTVSAFCEANRQVPRILQALLSSSTDLRFIHPGVVFEGKTQVGADSMVAEGATLGDKVSVKKSIIGRNCHIAEKTKISSSVIMDDVIIGENCHISGSVVCSGAIIGEKSELKDCLIGQKYEIAPDMKFTSETLTESEQFTLEY